MLFTSLKTPHMRSIGSTTFARLKIQKGHPLPTVNNYSKSRNS